MTDQTLLHLISASVSPAVMISGTAMLVMAFLGRQGVLTGRLRELHEKALHHAELFRDKGDAYQGDRAAYSLQQARAVYASARNVKWTLIFLFAAIVAFVAACIALGATVFAEAAVELAAVLFILGMANLLVATLFAMGGALRSLTPLKTEQAQTEKLLAVVSKIFGDRL